MRSLLSALYDPASPIYRHYLSVAQFTDRYGPSLDAYRGLLHYALAHHLEPEEVYANRRVLDVRGTVSDVERAFAVKIGVYREPNEARTFYAPDREPTIDVALPVLRVAGLDDEDVPVSHFIRSPQPAAVVNATGSGPDGNFIASDVRSAYYGGTALTGTGQSVGLFEFTGYNQSDVDAYFTAVGQKSHVPIVGVSLNGAKPRMYGAVQGRFGTGPRHARGAVDGARPQATRRLRRQTQRLDFQSDGERRYERATELLVGLQTETQPNSIRFSKSTPRKVRAC